MIEVEERDDECAVVVSLAGRLVFRRVGERWSHALEIADGRGFRAFAESVESDPARDDPRRVVSPTYQELHFQRQGDSVFALLVGQFGPHHFSAAIQVDEAASALVVRVDAADRCRSEVEALAATYAVREATGSLVSATDRAVSWEVAGGALVSLNGSGASVALQEAGAPTTMAQAMASIVPGRATQRLEYRWEIVAGGDAG